MNKQMNHQPAIREEELKNRVAKVYFGRFDCTRIEGNIDFCGRAEGLRIRIFETMTGKGESMRRETTRDETLHTGRPHEKLKSRKVERL